MDIDEHDREPSDRDAVVEPRGAGWWQRSLGAAPSAVSRRAMLQGLLVAGGMVAGLREAEAQSAPEATPDDAHTESRPALAMQRQYGWSFGATSEGFIFDGESQQPFDRAALARMPDDLRPARARHAPFYVPTLFQAPAALPHGFPVGDPTPVEPLKDALRPIFTPAMEIAYLRGKAFASLFANVWTSAGVIVDLPGPEAVAFSAGAADVLDPVFLFDNWPHPRGVVPAHLTLAAAAYYQPLFARRAAPSGAPPMLVLDRHRLAAYTDDAEQFDNRYVARLPGAAALRAIDVTHLLYVVPTADDDVELDDLNEDFLLYGAAGIDVKIVAADAFSADPSEPEPLPEPSGADPRRERRHHGYFYGGSLLAHGYFWIDYPWIPRPHHPGMVAPPFPRPGTRYLPSPRMSPHSSGKATASAIRARPPGFGTVHVVVSVHGLILGALMSRSGSWNRATSTGWGG